LPGFAIETKDLVKVYREGGVKAVDGLNLRVRKGEIYALIGANGSGKSTAVNMMTGALAPTSGSVTVLGMEIPRDRHAASVHIGVAPQEYSLYSDLTVEQNVRFIARLYGMQKEDFEKRFAEVLGVLRLEGRRDTTVANLSGGMKRRVSIACALIHGPSLVFFDEATVGIDPVMRAFFWQYFRSLSARGLTILLTSHVMDEAGKADRIGLLRAGRLIDEGEPQSLMERHGVRSIEEVFIKLSEKEFTDE
jgi:ABC-2 type transport system ATP-binding protein